MVLRQDCNIVASAQADRTDLAGVLSSAWTAIS